MRLKKFAWNLIFFTGFIAACTNPFSLRTPEPPVLNSGQNTLNLQSDPDSLLKKMQIAFAERNSTYYMETLSSPETTGKEFVFVPEKSESYRFTGWNRNEESNYFFNLTNQADLQGVTLRFYEKEEWRQYAGSVDTLTINVSYDIVVKKLTESQRFTGQAAFTVIRNKLSQWYIWQWEDFKRSDDQTEGTWSTLKANYRVQ